MENLTCVECGKNFQYRNKHMKTCSTACKESREKKLIKIRRGNKSVEKVCDYCGQTFDSYYPSQRFCKRECNSKFWNSKENRGMYHKICAHCGKHFESTSSDRKLCSEECRVAHRKLRGLSEHDRRLSFKNALKRAYTIANKKGE